MTTSRKPAWWQLFTLLPVLAGLFMLEHRAALPSTWHMGVKAGIVCVIYFLVWRWLRFNTYALIATLYVRHDYNGYTTDGWVQPTNGNGMTYGRPAPRAMVLDGQPTLAVTRQATSQGAKNFASRQRMNGASWRHWSKSA
jgi:hypothetical protein